MKDFGICVTHRLVPPLVFGFRFQFNHWLLHNCVTHILHTPVGTGAQSPVNLWKSEAIKAQIWLKACSREDWSAMLRKRRSKLSRNQARRKLLPKVSPYYKTSISSFDQFISSAKTFYVARSRYKSKSFKYIFYAKPYFCTSKLNMASRRIFHAESESDLKIALRRQVFEIS